MGRVEKCWERDFYANMYVVLEMIVDDQTSDGSVTGVCFLTPRKTVSMGIPVLSEDGVAGSNVAVDEITIAE